jgi:hypothetical protein
MEQSPFWHANNRKALKKFPSFMEAKHSFSHAEEPAIRPHSEPDDNKDAIDNKLVLVSCNLQIC